MSVMNTGIYNKTIVTLTALTVLSACSEGPVFDLLQNDGTTPLIKAQMVEGAVTLVPPSGYCIDSSSLTQTFALMARCDLLDAENGALNAPIGLLTASFATNNGQALSAADVAFASNAVVIETIDTGGLEIVRAKTDTPPNGLAKTHYRAATQIDGFDLSLALFSPPESEAQGARGTEMLRNLIKTSQDASIATDVAANTVSNISDTKKGFRATFSGLFE